MPIHRREFLSLVAAGAAAATLAPTPVPASRPAPIKAVAFDGFPIFDIRSIVAAAKALYPERGDAFAAAFRTRLFEYQWLRALAGHYKDFHSIVDDAHLFATRQLGLPFTDEKRAAFREVFLHLKAWPDVPNVLRTLKEEGVRLAFLSNMTPAMLHAGIANSGLDGVFDFVLSTDDVKTYKPDPRAYQMAVETFGMPKEHIAFAAFAGWDAAGANWFGFPTVWINRLNFPTDVLDAENVVTGRDLSTLTRFIAARAGNG